ncbi:unnamed protein product [Cylicocyclus nassatus]|uniref:Uncharacterized protein n=1 Tax=Cylicocyclus nassatus TaxID=53992 RepID=A0AA36H467_CYLNA|nr:unnamed protein product [Cylicocyclus nassatus]
MSVPKSVVCLLLLCGVKQFVSGTSSGRSEKVVGTVCKVRDLEKMENNGQNVANPEVKKEIPTIPYSGRARRDTETLECYVCDSTTESVPKKNEGVKSADMAPIPAHVIAKEEESLPDDVFEAGAEPQDEKSNRRNQKRAPTTCCIIKHENTASNINSTPAIQESCDPLSDTECSFSKTSWIGQFAISAESALI